MIHRQRGNALFLILIAVALFAALSYAITQSGRGSGDTARERTELSAASMMQSAGLIQQAAMRMMLSGCTVNQLSFDITPGTGGEENPSAPTDLSCHVFSSNGGGLAVPKPWGSSPENDVEGWYISKSFVVTGMGSNNGTGACAGCELSLVYTKVSDALCASLNKKLLGTSTIPVIARNLATPPYNGTFVGWHTIDNTEVTGASVEGKDGYCLNASLIPANVFIYPIVIR